MILKIDLEKAFDRIDWSFIRQALHLFNFPPNLTKLIMSYISSSSISVLINGSKINVFTHFREIRKEDPHSPYLFILCMELLSRRIDYEVNTLTWNPIAINRKFPKITHLFFADDLTLFAQANQKNCDTIKRTLDSFSKFSSQKINKAKSKVLFSRNCSSHTINNLASQLNNQARDTFGKFLGFPTFHKNPTKAEFRFILDI